MLAIPVTGSQNCGGTRHSAQQRDLSKPVAWTKLGDNATVSDDIGSAGLDHIEAVSRITLAKNGLAGGHLDRFQTASQLLDRWQRQWLEHGHVMKQPDFGVQLSDVAVEAPQASPCHQHKAWTKRTDDHQCNGNAGPFDQERGNERAHSNGESDQTLEHAKYTSEDIIGANLAISVNTPTCTSALPIPTHASRVRADASHGNNGISATGNPHKATPILNHSASRREPTNRDAIREPTTAPAPMAPVSVPTPGSPVRNRSSATTTVKTVSAPRVNVCACLSR